MDGSAHWIGPKSRELIGRHNYPMLFSGTIICLLLNIQLATTARINYKRFVLAIQMRLYAAVNWRTNCRWWFGTAMLIKSLKRSIVQQRQDLTHGLIVNASLFSIKRKTSACIL